MVAGSRILYKISLSGRSSRLWLSGLGAAALGAIVAVGCAQQPPTDTAASPSPTTTTSPAAAGSPAPFAQPMVAGKPGQPGQVAASPPVPVLDQFIPPTNPNTRATQTQADIAKNKDRRDPFAVPLQVGPVPELPAGYKPGQGGSNPGSPGRPGTAASPGTDSLGLPSAKAPAARSAAAPFRAAAKDLTIPLPFDGYPTSTGTLVNRGQFVGFPPPVLELNSPEKQDIRQRVQRNVNSPNLVGLSAYSRRELAIYQKTEQDRLAQERARAEAARALAAIPPSPSDAQAVSISGVVQVAANNFQVIVSAPGESTRYASVGQYVSNGKVLIKRIDLDSNLQPIVVLEQFGQEVSKSVGQT